MGAAGCTGDDMGAWSRVAAVLGWVSMVGALMSGVPAAGAEPATNAVATIVDGATTVTHGTDRFVLAEGVRLGDGDIVDTTGARLVRIELDDGRFLNLGPDTLVLLSPRFTGDAGRSAQVYLLHGWVKTNLAVAAPALDARQPEGVIVASIGPERARVYAESGRVELAEHRAGARPQGLKPGELFQRDHDTPSVVPRATPAFVAEMPRPFMDTLPSRAAQFKGRNVAPKALPVPTYAELQPWLDAEPALRKSYVARWLPLTHDAAFRKALAADLPAHREWERILFPERFKPASAPHSMH